MLRNIDNIYIDHLIIPSVILTSDWTNIIHIRKYKSGLNLLEESLCELKRKFKIESKRKFKIEKNVYVSYEIICEITWKWSTTSITKNIASQIQKRI